MYFKGTAEGWGPKYLATESLESAHWKMQNMMNADFVERTFPLSGTYKENFRKAIRTFKVQECTGEEFFRMTRVT